MIIRLGFDIAFESNAPTPMLLLLSTHPDVQSRLVTPEQIVVTPSIPVDTFIDVFGNRCSRLMAPTGKVQIVSDFLISDSGLLDPFVPDARQISVEELPAETLPFLFSSRYCEVDKIGEAAWELFGNTPLGWARVQAVCDWVHNHVEYGYALCQPVQDRDGCVPRWQRSLPRFSAFGGGVLPRPQYPGSLCRRLSGRHRHCACPDANGFSCMVRGVFGRAMVCLRCAAQCSAYRARSHELRGATLPTPH